MPTIIDELVVLLKLDGQSSFEKGQKQVQEGLDKSKKTASASGKEMEFRAKRSAESYAKLRGEVIALFTAFTAGVGLKDFISDTVKGEANLGRMSHALDMNVENLSAWQGVLRRNGGTAEDATAAFRSLADILAEVQTTGTTSKGGILMRMGLQASDLKDPERAIIKMAETARTMDPVIASSLLRQIGFSEAMTNAMLQGGRALQMQLEAQRKLGVITEADIKAAQRLQATLEGVEMASARVGAKILTALEPVLDLLGRGLSVLAEVAQRNAPIVMGALVGLTAAFVGVGIAAAGAAIAASPILGPLIVVSGVAVAAGVALGALWEVISRLAHGFLKFTRHNQAAHEALGEVQDAARGLWSALTDLLSPLRPLLDGLREIGAAIQDTFGGVAATAASAFISIMVNGLRAVADALRTVTALLRGDFKGALSAARDVGADLRGRPDQRSFRPQPVAPQTAQPSPPVAANDIIGQLRAGGLTEAQARGVAAGIWAESRNRPDATNPISGAFGIGQWLGKRKAELLRRYGPNPKLSQQLEFLVWELKGGDTGGRSVLGAQTDAAALNAYITRFMRPAPGAETTGDLTRGTAFLAANANRPGLGAQAQVSGPTTHSTTVTIESLHVNAPQARNGDEIAASVGPALQRRLGYVPQVASGIG